MGVVVKDRSLLVRFRERDSREGVTRATMKKIADALDLSETETVHRALVEYAKRFVPRYAMDEGPLSRERHARIAEVVREKHSGAKVVESLFDQPPAASKPRAKRVSSPRAR